MHHSFIHSFIMVEPWCHMDYFNDVLTPFLGHKRFTCVAVYAEKLSDFIKNIKICVPKMKEGLTGLEWHEGE